MTIVFALVLVGIALWLFFGKTRTTIKHYEDKPRIDFDL